jgi:hypothetical protein
MNAIKKNQDVTFFLNQIRRGIPTVEKKTYVRMRGRDG